MRDTSDYNTFLVIYFLFFKMRTIHLFPLLFYAVMAKGQVHRVEWPDIKQTKQQIFQVAAIELTDSTTVLEMQVNQKPGRWFMIDDDLQLRVPKGGKYRVKRLESRYGKKLGERITPRHDGEIRVRIIFPKLPANTEYVDLTGKRKTPFAMQGIRLDSLSWRDIWKAENQRIWDEQRAKIVGKELEVNTKNLKGKWKCTGDFLQDIGIGYYYPELRVSCTFKDDGSFVTRINGISHHSFRKEVFSGSRLVTMRSNRSKTAYIKVKGTYRLEDGKITTMVSGGDVECSFDNDQDHPNLSNPQLTQNNLRIYEMEDRQYDEREKRSEQMGETLQQEMASLWTWTNEPVIVASKRLFIGRKILFSK